MQAADQPLSASPYAAWGQWQNLPEALLDARRHTLELQQDLSEPQLQVPQWRIINPPIWELGHVGWFQEFWILRHLLGRPPLRDDADRLWNSSAVAHDTRWDLPLLTRRQVLDYLQLVLDSVLAALPARLSAEQAYFCWLALMHEDMHGEAFLYTRQTLAWPAPVLSLPPVALALPAAPSPADAAGDVSIPGGRFPLGAAPGAVAFDNEKWAHWVELQPFAIARSPVTYGQMAEFADDGGYSRRELWSPEGWQWLQREHVMHPLYWRREGGAWLHRQYQQWQPLPAGTPVIHVNFYEAEAWCRWAGRRLPSEAEWELAASLGPAAWNSIRSLPAQGSGAASAAAAQKSPFPWGSEPPSPAHAVLDAVRLGPQPLAACSLDRGGFGLRHLIGNVWEWTASPFAPFPGFLADPYRDYSQPWFTPDYRVLRGGCWATRARLLRNTWRNFYTRDRRDVLAGFRTCAL